MIAAPVWAQKPDMFSKNSARTVFSPKVTVNVAKSLLPAEEDKAKKLVSDSSDIAQVSGGSENPRDQIISEFGDPDKPHRVKAQSTAPKPYQAMIKAIGSGEKELAYKYAQQYVKYRADLKKVIREAVAFEGVAMVGEGELPEDSWVASDDFKQYREEYKQYIQDEEEELKPESGQIGSQAQQLITKAKLNQKFDETNLFKGSTLEKQEIAKQDRQRAREEMANIFRVSADKQLDIFFFFKPTDQKSIDLAKQLEEYKSEYADSKINLIGFAPAGTRNSDLRVFKQRTKAKFKLLQGGSLIEQLNITKLPSIMFINPANAEFKSINRSISADYIDEVVSIIRGRNV